MREYHDILEKLRKIEALYAGAATPGERQAAEAARDRIRRKLQETERAQRPEEWRFSLDNPWSRRLLIALARRYGLTPYRRHGQRRTTVMVSAPRAFVEDILIPEFEECNAVLLQHLEFVATEVIEQALSEESSDPEDREELPQ